MDNQTFQELKKDYINHIENYVNEYGSLFAHISIFADIIKPESEEENKPAIIHIPIPGEYLDSSDGKDRFVEQVLPEIIINVKEKFNPIAIGWAAEATMRVAGKLFDVKKDDWTKIPVSKDVVIISIDAKDNSQTYLYEVKQLVDDNLSNLKIDKDGEILKRVELVDITDNNVQNFKHVGGRFTDLYKKFLD